MESVLETNESSYRLTYSKQQKFPIKKEIPSHLLKQLIDKNYERRKQAGVEMQDLMKHLIEKHGLDSVKSAIEFFKGEYLDSINDLNRKAGLMAYSAIASSIMENPEGPKFIPDLMRPVLACCRDYTSKVRYYAIETLYNIVKVSRHHVLPAFPDIFRSLIDLFADVDVEVKKAAGKFDNLLKTVLVECEADSKYFDSDQYMDLLKEMLTGAGNTNVQFLLVSWIMVLDSIPDFDILHYFPKIITGLFMMLKSQKKSVKLTVSKFLGEILTEIKDNIESEDIDLGSIEEALSKLTRNENKFVRKEACSWIHQLLESGGIYMSHHFDQCLKAVFHCLSDPETSICSIAEKCDERLINLVILMTETDSSFDSTTLIEVLMSNVNHKSKTTRTAVIEWVNTLQTFSPESIELSLDDLLSSLITRLNDPEDSVMQQALKAICLIAQYKNQLQKVLRNVVDLFFEQKEVLEDKGVVIVQTFAQELGHKTLLQNFSQLLYEERNKDFCSKLIDVLSDLLFTDSGFEELRERLKYCLENQDQEAIEFFESTFKAWSSNAGAALTLSYLTQSFKLAYESLHILSRCKITIELMKQLARLVDLLDSPIFVHLRLQMLEQHRHPYLLRSLYAILMFLPASRAYQVLKLRLKDISTLYKNFPQQNENQLTRMHMLRYEELITRFIEVNLPPERYKNMTNFLLNVNKV